MVTRIAVFALMLFGLGGCMSMELGAPIRIDRLPQLTPKVSSKSDVLLSLGEPSGTGAMRWSADVAPRSVWFYENIRSVSNLVTSGNQQKVTILLVLFNGDRYDGHYWFGEDVAVGKGARP